MILILLTYLIITIIVWLLLKRISLIDDFHWIEIPILAMFWPLTCIIVLIAAIEYGNQKNDDLDNESKS